MVTQLEGTTIYAEENIFYKLKKVKLSLFS